MFTGISLVWCALCFVSVAVAYVVRKRFECECTELAREAQQCNMHLRYIQQDASSKGGVRVIASDHRELAEAMAYTSGLPVEASGQYLRKMVYPQFDQIAARYNDCIKERNESLWLKKLMTWTMVVATSGAVVVGIRLILLWYR
jgi:hypothetical protein